MIRFCFQYYMAALDNDGAFDVTTFLHPPSPFLCLKIRVVLFGRVRALEMLSRHNIGKDFACE